MVDFFEVIIVGLVLSADSFSAAIALGARKHRWSDSLKFALSSGGAEALVSFFGAVAGSKLISKLDSVDHWISFFLLLSVSTHMLFEGLQDLKSKEANQTKEFHGFLKILIVSFATSLDALAVGISLGVSKKPLIPYISSIGLWAFFSTIIGMGIAKRASAHLGPIFNLIGAFILFGLGVKFLFEGL